MISRQSLESLEALLADGLFSDYVLQCMQQMTLIASNCKTSNALVNYEYMIALAEHVAAWGASCNRKCVADRSQCFEQLS